MPRLFFKGNFSLLLASLMLSIVAMLPAVDAQEAMQLCCITLALLPRLLDFKKLLSLS